MTDWNPDNAVDLGVWEDLGWTQPLPPKKSRLSLKLKQTPKSLPKPDLFESPEKSLDSYQKPFVPENTKVNTRWAVKNFDDWVASYNLRHREEPCPEGILLCDDASELSRWLQKYILSTRKKTGEKYPPRTMHLLLSGLQRHMREKKEKSFDIFSREAVAFKQLVSTYSFSGAVLQNCTINVFNGPQHSDD